jgi:general L-amino acid transport system permease protein
MSDLHAHSVAYVRDTMLPQSEPPMGERGALRWLRTNLFSSWFNAILTVVSLVLVAMLVRAIFPWLANSVWSTSSLDQCREALHGTLGACFSVITERWRQVMYGFYPQEL